MKIERSQWAHSSSHTHTLHAIMHTIIIIIWCVCVCVSYVANKTLWTQLEITIANCNQKYFMFNYFYWPATTATVSYRTLVVSIIGIKWKKYSYFYTHTHTPKTVQWDFQSWKINTKIFLKKETNKKQSYLVMNRSRELLVETIKYL